MMDDVIYGNGGAEGLGSDDLHINIRYYDMSWKSSAENWWPFDASNYYCNDDYGYYHPTNDEFSPFQT